MDDLEKLSLRLELLNKYSFCYGVLPEDSNVEIDVNVLNPDDTTSKRKMNVVDVIYLTETGTITLPGRHILQRFETYFNHKLNEELNTIVDDIIDKEISDTEIYSRLRLLAEHFQIYLRNMYKNEVAKNNVANTIINKDKDDTKYLCNLNTLSKYLKCIVKKS